MKIIIRKINAALYLNSRGWTEDIALAHNFEKAGMAIRHASSNQLDNVEIVYAFPEERYNFSIGISKSPNGSRSQPAWL